MIFVTTGTTQYDFTRLFVNLERSLINLNITEKVIIQANQTTYKPLLKNIQLVERIPYQQNLEHLKQSKLTICHGGISSIVLAVTYCPNKAIIVPRYAKYNEHVNNHQVDFCKKIKKLYPVYLLLDSDFFQTKLQHLIANPQINPLLGKNNPPNQKAINLLDDFCQKYTH